MKTIFYTKPINYTPDDVDQFNQIEVDTLEDAITLYQAVNTGSLDAAILTWHGTANGYRIYASTEDDIKIPINPPGEE